MVSPASVSWDWTEYNMSNINVCCEIWEYMKGLCICGCVCT